MKISEITQDFVKEYCRIDYEENSLNLYMNAAKSYIKSYTGLDDVKIDTMEDLTIAYLALTSEMYDSRSFTVDKNNINKILDSILNIHCTNLL